jgi:hypothetical protein
MRALSLAPLAALLALAGVACTERNPCFQNGCRSDGRIDSSAEPESDARDAADVAVDATDANDAPGPVDSADVTKRCSGPADCTSDPDGRACDTVSGKCVTCVGDGDCRTDGGTFVCDTSAHACVECTTSTHCAGTRPICDTAARTCVQCLQTSHCSGTTPICDTTAKTCHACKTDGDCVSAAGADPGLCAPNGHCVGNSEVYYAIQPTSSACGTANGTTTMPYCTAREAVTAAANTMTGRPFVVLRGALGGFSVGASNGRITVVGQGAVVLNPGGDPYGVDVTGTADVLIRHVSIGGGASGGAHVSGATATLSLVDDQISGSAGKGVFAENGAKLVMNRCVVVGTGQITTPPALQTATGAGFHVTNSVFARAAIGADLGVAAGGEQLFKNNTIVGNAVAMQCAGAISAGGLIFQGNTSVPGSGCTGTTCCTGDPLLTADYHLMSGSPCIDQLTPDPDVPDDLDGQSRPLGASLKSDCGADEFGALTP